jgi:hypothetical protein
LNVDQIVLTQSISFLRYASIVPHPDGTGKPAVVREHLSRAFPPRHHPEQRRGSRQK